MQVYKNKLCWNLPGPQQPVYLTFDDGPHPVSTPQVLEILEHYGISATFFCVGKQVAQYPHLFQQITQGGHVTGNHSFTHLNGWKTNTAPYINDVHKAAQYIPSPLFRPPYGRIKPSQINALSEHYKIIMYDVMSYDYDKNVPTQQVIKNISQAVNGSIIVLHDHQHTAHRIQHILPPAIEMLKKSGFVCSPLPLSGL